MFEGLVGDGRKGVACVLCGGRRVLVAFLGGLRGAWLDWGEERWRGFDIAKFWGRCWCLRH